jgi:hypothetical protein
VGGGRGTKDRDAASKALRKFLNFYSSDREKLFKGGIGSINQRMPAILAILRRVPAKHWSTFSAHAPALHIARPTGKKAQKRE